MYHVISDFIEIDGTRLNKGDQLSDDHAAKLEADHSHLMRHVVRVGERPKPPEPLKAEPPQPAPAPLLKA